MKMHDPLFEAGDFMDEQLISVLDEKGLPEELYSAYYILAENKFKESDRRQDMKGVNLAYELLSEDPMRHVVIFSMATLRGTRGESVCEMNPLTEVVLLYSNVLFVRLPITKSGPFNREEFLAALEVAKAEMPKPDPTALTRHIHQQIAEALHKLPGPGHTSLGDPDINREVARVGRQLFRFDEKVDDAVVVGFMMKISMDRRNVAKGKRFPGVHCDLEGALLDENRKVKPVVLTQLEGFESDGHPITLMTDGNVSALEQVVRDQGVTYPVYHKIKFSGGVVEIAMDDQTKEVFIAKTNITPETFIQIE